MFIILFYSRIITIDGCSVKSLS